MQVVNTNIASLNSQRSLSKTGNDMRTAIERLSSGLRINSAKDDAAGLAIGNRMTAQIRGLNQAARNANDGISVSQVAEGALGEIGNMLQRMRELAVQSASDSNTTSDRLSLQKEFGQLNAEIDRIAQQTQYNGKNVLDGSFTSQAFHVGAYANQSISVSISDSRATAIGAYTANSQTNIGVLAAGATSATNSNGVAAQALTISGPLGTSTIANTTIVANSTAKAIADAVNAVTSTTGVSATASSTATLAAVSHAGTVAFTLTGRSNASISAAVTTTDLGALADAINNAYASTGISATLSSNKASITLVNSEGYDIKIDDYTNSGNAAATATVAGTTITNGANDSIAVGGKVAFSGTGAYTLTSSTGTTLLAGGTQSGSLSAVSSAKVDSQSNSNSAITTIDGAITFVNDLRATLGAVQSRFESAASNLGSASENVAAARSRVMDADFASETAAMSRAQVLQQAGTAMLAQANALPQSVLSLLRG